MILDTKAAGQLEDKRAKADSLLDILMRDDEVRSLLLRKVRALCLASNFKELNNS
jgi:hypothetical protein